MAKIPTVLGEIDGSASDPPPAKAFSPSVVPAVASPSASCVDHSQASEQGLEHGKGHHKC